MISPPRPTSRVSTRTMTRIARSSSTRSCRLSWHGPLRPIMLGSMKRDVVVFGCAVALAGCREHRRIDPAPVESTNPVELPSGVVQASFELNTGGDQMSSRPVDAGLVLRVAFGRRLLLQQLASCQDAGRGNALADGSAAIDWAICDGTTYSVHVSDTRVEVREDRSHAVITTIALPPGLHAVR